MTTPSASCVITSYSIHYTKLYDGEEQGLLGSRAYVRQHLGSRNEPMPERERVSGYFNLDNGTGRIRGVYLQGNSGVGPIFSQWMRVLNSDSISVGHIAPGNTGGSYNFV